MKTTTAPDVEVVPSKRGGMSALASADAPFIYFDAVTAHGLYNGIMQITLEACRLGVAADGTFAPDRVMTGHLRCSVPAMKSLRDSIDKLLFALQPVQGGQEPN